MKRVMADYEFIRRLQGQTREAVLNAFINALKGSYCALMFIWLNIVITN